MNSLLTNEILSFYASQTETRVIIFLFFQAQEAAVDHNYHNICVMCPLPITLSDKNALLLTSYYVTKVLPFLPRPHYKNNAYLL